MPLPLVYLYVVILGWTSGILINYLSEALPYKRRLVAPFCTGCGEQMPVWNYFFWPRRCSKCNKHRPWRTWLVELVSVLLTLFLWNYAPYPPGFYVSLILLVYFGTVAVIDLEYRLILHPTSIAGAILGLVVGTWMHGILFTIIGGVAGFGTMFFFYYFGTLFARFVAKRRGEVLEEEALGFGDVNLSGVLGLLLGWPQIVIGLFLAILLGAVVSLIYMLTMVLIRRYRFFAAIPYGPFLITGAAILIYFRDFLLAVLPK
ncbi:MAG: prepilin peptidase [Omnitrophica WOR_2 bacterium]